VNLRKALYGDDASAPAFESFNEKVADFATSKPELYPQTIAGKTVLDVVDYTAKIQKLDPTYQPEPYEAQVRSDHVNEYRIQEYVRKLQATGPMRVVEGRNGMVLLPGGFNSEQESREHVRRQVETLEAQDRQLPAQDARERAARAHAREHPTKPKESCGHCAVQ